MEGVLAIIVLVAVCTSPTYALPVGRSGRGNVRNQAKRVNATIKGISIVGLKVLTEFFKIEQFNSKSKYDLRSTCDCDFRNVKDTIDVSKLTSRQIISYCMVLVLDAIKVDRVHGLNSVTMTSLFNAILSIDFDTDDDAATNKDFRPPSFLPRCSEDVKGLTCGHFLTIDLLTTVMRMLSLVLRRLTTLG